MKSTLILLAGLVPAIAFAAPKPTRDQACRPDRMTFRSEGGAQAQVLRFGRLGPRALPVYELEMEGRLFVAGHEGGPGEPHFFDAADSPGAREIARAIRWLPVPAPEPMSSRVLQVEGDTKPGSPPQRTNWKAVACRP